jgi:hypothetical protein
VELSGDGLRQVFSWCDRGSQGDLRRRRQDGEELDVVEQAELFGDAAP